MKTHRKYSVEEICQLIDADYKIIGQSQGLIIDNVKAIYEADKTSLVWVNPDRLDRNELVRNTASRVIITDASIDFNDTVTQEKCFIVVKKPKFAYINVLNRLFSLKSTEFGVHPTAYIHPEASVHQDVFIGPFTYVGKSKIDRGTIIDGHVFIYDNVTIGKNVRIQAGCIIGAEGLNTARDEKGNEVQFPHIGGVTIRDNVRIDVMTHIDRGALGDTTLEENVKIDNCTYIAHNSRIGKNTVIIGHSMISGSVTVGDNCWIGPSTIVRDGITIGNRCLIGMGSLVVKNIEDNLSVMGSPTRPIDEYKKILNFLKNAIK